MFDRFESFLWKMLPALDQEELNDAIRCLHSALIYQNKGEKRLWQHTSRSVFDWASKDTTCVEHDDELRSFFLENMEEHLLIAVFVAYGNVRRFEKDEPLFNEDERKEALKEMEMNPATILNPILNLLIAYCYSNGEFIRKNERKAEVYYDKVSKNTENDYLRLFGKR